jgi:hypothetical protein
VVLLALFHRQREAADALLAAGPELGVLEAAATGRADLLRDLLAASRAPSATGRRRASPRSAWPPSSAAPRPSRVLLEHGADADDDADNQFGVRPVHAAAAAHDRETMRLLLEAGADPNLRQRGGFAPLHEAAHSDDVEMARLLLAHGADPASAADDGRDSLRMAVDDGQRRRRRPAHALEVDARVRTGPRLGPIDEVEPLERAAEQAVTSRSRAASERRSSSPAWRRARTRRRRHLVRAHARDLVRSGVRSVACSTSSA